VLIEINVNTYEKVSIYNNSKAIHVEKQKYLLEVVIPGMMKTSEVKTTTIDAEGQNLGRLAARIALMLRGKDEPTFAPNRAPRHKVIVVNTDKLAILPQKMDRIYFRHSQYPGGIKQETLAELMRRDSRKVMRAAVYGMLPKNKLRDRQIAKLALHKGQK
jgi:large subunit ribosomal protein L13